MVPIVSSYSPLSRGNVNIILHCSTPYKSIERPIPQSFSLATKCQDIIVFCGRMPRPLIFSNRVPKHTRSVCRINPAHQIHVQPMPWHEFGSRLIVLSLRHTQHMSRQYFSCTVPSSQVSHQSGCFIVRMLGSRNDKKLAARGDASHRICRIFPMLVEYI